MPDALQWMPPASTRPVAVSRLVPDRRLLLRPGWRALLTGLCVAAVLTFGWAGGAIAQGDPSITLIPESEVPRGPPRDTEDALARSAELVRKYPRDPRARLDRAAALLITTDLIGAERELRAGLAEEKTLARLNPAVSSMLRATLAKTLLLQSRQDEATAMARPLCDSETRFRIEVAKVGLCPDLGPAGRHVPGELDPVRLVAVAKAASELKALARDGRSPHMSDPAAGALFDAVLDVGDLTRETPLITQMAGIGRWSILIGEVCGMYDLPTAPQEARERMRSYAPEIGRCLDALLGASGAGLAATADPPAWFRGMLEALKPNPHQMVIQAVQITLATMSRPEPADAWRRARLPALAALAERAGPLLTADERRRVAASVLSVSRAARDAALRTGLMGVASRLGDK